MILCDNLGIFVQLTFITDFQFGICKEFSGSGIMLFLGDDSKKFVHQNGANTFAVL